VHYELQALAADLRCCWTCGSFCSHSYAITANCLAEQFLIIAAAAAAATAATAVAAATPAAVVATALTATVLIVSRSHPAPFLYVHFSCRYCCCNFCCWLLPLLLPLLQLLQPRLLTQTMLPLLLHSILFC